MGYIGVMSWQEDEMAEFDEFYDYSSALPRAGISMKASSAELPEESDDESYDEYQWSMLKKWTAISLFNWEIRNYYYYFYLLFVFNK